jgi:hypothetical protein
MPVAAEEELQRRLTWDAVRQGGTLCKTSFDVPDVI